MKSKKNVLIKNGRIAGLVNDKWLQEKKQKSIHTTLGLDKIM